MLHTIEGMLGRVQTGVDQKLSISHVRSRRASSFARTQKSSCTPARRVVPPQIAKRDSPFPLTTVPTVRCSPSGLVVVNITAGNPEIFIANGVQLKALLQRGTLP